MANASTLIAGTDTTDWELGIVLLGDKLEREETSWRSLSEPPLQSVTGGTRETLEVPGSRAKDVACLVIEHNYKFKEDRNNLKF